MEVLTCTGDHCFGACYCWCYVCCYASCSGAVICISINPAMQIYECHFFYLVTGDLLPKKGIIAFLSMSSTFYEAERMQL